MDTNEHVVKRVEFSFDVWGIKAQVSKRKETRFQSCPEPATKHDSQNPARGNLLEATFGPKYFATVHTLVILSNGARQFPQRTDGELFDPCTVCCACTICGSTGKVMPGNTPFTWRQHHLFSFTIRQNLRGTNLRFC